MICGMVRVITYSFQYYYANDNTTGLDTQRHAVQNKHHDFLTDLSIRNI